MAVTTMATTIFPEEGTVGIEISFYDEDDVALTPNADTIKYTLTDRPAITETPNIINSIEQSAISSASTITIVLSGDDLALQASETNNEYAKRALTIEYEYDSDLGSDLPGKAQYYFKIKNMNYIT